MQAKNHMAKLIKFSSKLPSWRTLKGSDNRLHYCNKNFWDASGQTDVGHEEIDLRIKNLLSWQDILNDRQIAPDIEEKLANQGKVFVEESVVFIFPYQTNGNHATEP